MVGQYKYMGLIFDYNGKFTEAKKQLVVKGNRAMFLLLRKCRQLPLPVDIQLELFDIIIKPILLYIDVPQIVAMKNANSAYSYARSQNAVNDYFLSEQLLPFGFRDQYTAIEVNGQSVGIYVDFPGRPDPYKNVYL